MLPDPEDLDDARHNAPLTVLCMDRIVSLRDCENFARSFAGIGKAYATLIRYDQTMIVNLTIASATGQPVEPISDLYTNLMKAIDAAKDPIMQIRLDSFRQKLFNIEAKIMIANDREFENIKLAVEATLKKAFSFTSREFGQAVTASEIISVIQKTEGIIGVNLDALYLFDPSPPVFTWENVFNCDQRFLKFLEENLKIDWIAKWKQRGSNQIERSKGGDAIKIFFSEMNYYVLSSLNNEKNSITIKIDDGREYQFIVKREEGSGTLNVYLMRVVKSIPAQIVQESNGELLPSELLVLNPKGITLIEMMIS